MMNVSFITSDGVSIKGDWYEAERIGGRCALLLHMMPATKESWKTFAEVLLARGISCLAIDLRGHGESTEGGKLDYKKFTDANHQTSRLDVEASLAWLAARGFEESRIAIVGASIGANLALRAMVEHEQIKIGIALSPGVDYRGVTTNDAVEKLRNGQLVLLCASEDDPQSFGAVNELNELNCEQTRRIILERAGHGTAMFEHDGEFMKQCAEWIEKKL
jgi:pimeloyl-ACP methyl ester carboxylesterase